MDPGLLAGGIGQSRWKSQARLSPNRPGLRIPVQTGLLVGADEFGGSFGVWEIGAGHEQVTAFADQADGALVGEGGDADLAPHVIARTEFEFGEWRTVEGRVEVEGPIEGEQEHWEPDRRQLHHPEPEVGVAGEHAMDREVGDRQRRGGAQKH